MLNVEGARNEKLYNTVRKMLTMLLMASDENKDEDMISTELVCSQTRVACELCAWLDLFSKYE